MHISAASVALLPTKPISHIKLQQCHENQSATRPWERMMNWLEKL